MKRYKVTLYINDEDRDNIGLVDEDKGNIIEGIEKELFEDMKLDDWEWEEIKE